MTFVGKLYNMLETPQVQHLLHWAESGESFIVENPEEFSCTILPKFFKHGKFASFVRQLNMYDFHKVTEFIPQRMQSLVTSPEQLSWEFRHAKFKRGRPDLVAEIKRKIPRSAEMRRSERQAQRAFPLVRPHHFPNMVISQPPPLLPSNLLSTSVPGMMEMPSVTSAIAPEHLSVNPNNSKLGAHKTGPSLMAEHRISDLEDKVRQLHENWGLLWNELMSCRQQLQGEHQVLQNMTQFLASAFTTEEKDAKRSLEAVENDRQKEEDQRRYSLVLQSLYYGVPRTSLPGAVYNHGSIGGFTAGDTGGGRTGSFAGTRPFDDYYNTWPSFGMSDRKDRSEHYVNDPTMKEI